MSLLQRSMKMTESVTLILKSVQQDGSVSHFFHRAIKAYNTRTRKRRKIHGDDFGDFRWHKTGRTKPVVLDGVQQGCKKIMVLYASPVKGGKAVRNSVVRKYVLDELNFKAQNHKVHECANGMNFKSELQAKHLDLLQSPWLIELVAFCINLNDSDSSLTSDELFGPLSIDLNLTSEGSLLTLVLLGSEKLDCSLICPICLDLQPIPFDFDRDLISH
ncbi:putative transcription factor NAM family [Helianthus annuus]|nr:putative transcription factor NAM family [Helianthus annuus]